MEIELVRLQRPKTQKWQKQATKSNILALLKIVIFYIFGTKSVYVLAVCPRRTTLKSGSLHFADEGPIIISNGVVTGGSAAVPAAGTTGSVCLLFTSICLQWQCMCLIVCMYGVQGIYGVQGVHMGRKLAMRESVDRRGDEQQK
jgi:hypothetical protein